jgi:hypothetical protein
MASNKRKKTFPKAPVRFHSGLTKELGKNSNKAGHEASIKAIYHRHAPKGVALSPSQEKQLQTLRENLAKREKNGTINHNW